MAERFVPGDFLIFQIESGFGLLRVLDVEEANGNTVWHLTAYRDLFMDVEMAEDAITQNNLTPEIAHTAMTDRAFESTQTSLLTNQPLTASEEELIHVWRADPENQPTDRSVRLLLGLR